jgi:hypothetical protein
VDGCRAAATTGQLEPRPDPAAEEQCEQTDRRKHEVSAASTPSRVGNQRGKAGTRRSERRFCHQKKLL